MMEDLDWDKLTCRWEQQLLIQTFKCLKQIAPVYISSNFIFTYSTHSKCTRSQSQNSLVVPTWKTISEKRTFHYRASVLWNNLPPKLCVNLDILSVNPVNKMMEDMDWDKLTCRWEQQLLARV